MPWLGVTADISLAKAIELGFVPFVPGEIVKAALTGPAADRMEVAR